MPPDERTLAAGISIPGPAWGALGIAITALVNLWRGRRTDRAEAVKIAAEKAKVSGSIETSDADQVWQARGDLFQEAERIRHELRDEVDRLRSELVEARASAKVEIDRLRSDLTEARAELVDCRSRVSTLEPTVRDLTARLKLLEDR